MPRGVRSRRPLVLGRVGKRFPKLYLSTLSTRCSTEILHAEPTYAQTRMTTVSQLPLWVGHVAAKKGSDSDIKAMFLDRHV